MRDLLHAWRAIRRMPVLATVVVVSLAAGIAVNTIVFSFIQSRVLRPLPGVPDAANVRLVEPRADTGSYPGASWQEFRDLRARLGAFESLFAFRIQALTVGEAALAERASGLLVSGDYFSALRLRPARGRLLASTDAAQPGSAPVVVLSYDYWQNRFAGAADVVGRTLRVNGSALTVVGVAPADFRGTVIGMRFDLWVPATMAPLLLNGSRELDDRASRGYQLAGRLARGATVAQAQTELIAAMGDLAIAHSDTNQAVTGEVLPFWKSPRGPQRMLARALAILQGIMLVLLLAVCGNTATLLLARASTRQREAGVHLALGAEPARIVRLFLAETLVLAVIAAALGVMAAMWGTRAVSAIPLSSGFPIRTDAAVDGLGMLFAVLLACGSALLFGAAPAVQLARVDSLRALGQGSRATAHGWLRRLTMGAQVALAVVVLMAAGLFFRSLQDARDIDPGFVREGVLLGRYELTGRANAGASSSREFARRALDALRALPGVESAAIAQQVPLDIHGLPLISFTLEGRPSADGATDRALSNLVTPGYFATMRMPLLKGTDFVPLDERGAERQAIVNRAFVARYLADAEPIGRGMALGGRRHVITGIVENSVSEAFGEPPTPAVYLSYRDRPAPVGQLHVRTASGHEPQLAAGLRQVVASIDASLPVYDIRTLADHVENNLGLRKIPARMFMVIGPLLLVLAAIGIYAVVAYAVAQRRTEIGIRLAIGATGRRVVSDLVQDHMRVVMTGTGCGWLAAYVAYRSVVGEAVDAAVFAGVPLLLLAVATLATWWPARIASAIDPVCALRGE